MSVVVDWDDRWVGLRRRRWVWATWEIHLKDGGEFFMRWRIVVETFIWCYINEGRLSIFNWDVTVWHIGLLRDVAVLDLLMWQESS